MSGLETQTCVERSYQVGTSPLPYQFLVDDDEKQDQTSPVCSGSGPDRAEDSCQAGPACTQKAAKGRRPAAAGFFLFRLFFLTSTVGIASNLVGFRMISLFEFWEVLPVKSMIFNIENLN